MHAPARSRRRLGRRRWAFVHHIAFLEDDPLCWWSNPHKFHRLGEALRRWTGPPRGGGGDVNECAVLKLHGAVNADVEAACHSLTESRNEHAACTEVNSGLRPRAAELSPRGPPT
jgi:hypothetical protein